MERLVIAQTDSTLGVDFDPERRCLLLRGESYPENAAKFFAPVLQWLETWLPGLAPGAEVAADLDIVYFNSSSSKVLMNLFDLFEETARRGVRLSVLWRYHEDNEIAQECGEEFGQELQAAAFAMHPYQETP